MRFDSYSCYRFDFSEMKKRDRVLNRTQEIISAWEDEKKHFSLKDDSEDCATINALITLSARFLAQQAVAKANMKILWPGYLETLKKAFELYVSESV